MLNLHKTSLILLFLVCYAGDVLAKYPFSISGSVPIIYDGVEIKLSSDNPAFQWLSTKAKKGKFDFSGIIEEEYENVYLTIKKDNENLGWWTFFIKGGKMEIKILNLKDKNSENNIQYYNVPFIDEQKRYGALIKPVEDSLIFASSLLQYGNERLQSRYDQDSLTAVIRALKVEKLTKKIEFVKTVLNTYIGLYIFNQEVVKGAVNELITHPDSLMSIYSAFNKSLKNTDLGKSIYASIFKRRSLLINAILPDFSFSTNKGIHHNLSSFRNNKYILLCFWDSWCKPCIKSIPLLKRIAKNYETKDLQMISVSIDNNETKWLSSLQKYDLPWLQTCDIPRYVKGLNIQSLYNINYIPQYFLIDKNGRLIYHNVQLKDSDDYNILQKMLGDLLN